MKSEEAVQILSWRATNTVWFIGGNSSVSDEPEAIFPTLQLAYRPLELAWFDFDLFVATTAHG
jgi:hypothetical protein